MAVKLPDDPKKLKSLCERYQKQVKELTQKCERENLDWGMEEYYLTQKIRDFEKLCENNKIDFGIVNELDKKRRHLPSATKEPVTEEQFLSVFAHYYPHAHVYNVDDGDADNIWARTLGNTETERVLYIRSAKEIRTWRNYGIFDYHFGSINEFEDWLAKAHVRGIEFECESDL